MFKWYQFNVSIIKVAINLPPNEHLLIMCFWQQIYCQKVNYSRLLDWCSLQTYPRFLCHSWSLVLAPNLCPPKDAFLNNVPYSPLPPVCSPHSPFYWHVLCFTPFFTKHRFVSVLDIDPFLRSRMHFNLFSAAKLQNYNSMWYYLLDRSGGPSSVRSFRCR